MRIYLDIETIPAEETKQVFLNQAKENYKDPNLTIDQICSDLGIDKDRRTKAELMDLWRAQFQSEHIEQSANEDWRKTSFNGGLGRVLMIGVAIDDDEPIVFYHENEAEVLSQFRAHLDVVIKLAHNTRPTFIGHNVIDFDLKFLYHRYVVNNIKPHFTLPINPSRYSDAVHDTMYRWAGFGGRVSLDTLAGYLGLEGKGEIDGSKVFDYYNEGRIDELIEYCAHDVTLTRQIHKRLYFLDSPYSGAFL